MLLYKQLIVNIGRLHNKRVNEENTRIKKENYYTKAKLLMQEADTEQAYREANKIFTAISGYKDCAELAGQCAQMADNILREMEEKKIERFHNLIEEYEELKKYEQPALRLPDLQKKYGELSAQKQTTTNFLPSFPEKSRQLNIVESEIEETKAKIVSLKNEYKTLGFFSSKRKKAIENILPVHRSNIDSMTKKAAQLRHQLHGYTSTDEIEQKIRNLVLQLDKISEEIAIASEAKKKLYDVDRIFKAIHDEGLADYIFSEKRVDILAQWMDYQVKNSELAEVKFGKYMDRPIEWLVLEKIDKRILVISKEALDCQPYNTSKTDVTWETCSLRNWLNDTFLNAAFALEEQAMLSAVTVSADKNPDCSTEPGKSTQDKVFLLSIPEVNKYFTSENARQCVLTDCTVANRAYIDRTSGNCRWWLRSPGYDQYRVTSVECDGSIDKIGHLVDLSNGAVRPALWIDLGE